MVRDHGGGRQVLSREPGPAQPCPLPRQCPAVSLSRVCTIPRGPCRDRQKAPLPLVHRPTGKLGPIYSADWQRVGFSGTPATSPTSHVPLPSRGHMTTSDSNGNPPQTEPLSPHGREENRRFQEAIPIEGQQSQVGTGGRTLLASRAFICLGKVRKDWQGSTEGRTERAQ